MVVDGGGGVQAYGFTNFTDTGGIAAVLHGLFNHVEDLALAIGEGL
jgi:hypothetical protein